MAEFKVGGKVVCVKDHSLKLVREGKIYTIASIFTCKCGNISLDVGISYPKGKSFSTCSKCDDIRGTKRPLFNTILFLPLDDFQQVTFTKILEQVPVGAQ